MLHERLLIEYQDGSGVNCQVIKRSKKGIILRVSRPTGIYNGKIESLRVTKIERANELTDKHSGLVKSAIWYDKNKKAHIII